MAGINWLEKIAGRGASEKFKQKQLEEIYRQSATRSSASDISFIADKSPISKENAANEQSIAKTGEGSITPEKDPWDPCNLTFHYFSGAECPPVSSPKKESDSFFRRPDHPSLYRSTSDLMPQVCDPTKASASKTEWGGPDPTCYEVPEDCVHRTYSSSSVWDPAECPVVPLPVTTGIGIYRRDPNTTPEWCEEKYKAHVAELGPIAARACRAYELAGIKPEPISDCRKTSFSSNCTMSSQYSEVVDEQGRVMKIYRGFVVPVHRSTSSLSQDGGNARRNSASSTTDLAEGPYTRQVIRPTSRRSFIVKDALKPVTQQEELLKPSRNKSSVNLELAAPGHAESAIDSDDDSWEEVTPEIVKKPLVQPPKPQNGKISAGKRIMAGKIGEYKGVGSDRAKTTTRKPTGAVLRRHNSHDKPTLKPSNSNDKKIRENVQQAIAGIPTEAVLLEATLGHDIIQKLEGSDFSVMSEAEIKRAQELETLREDDNASISSTSSEKTALPSIKIHDRSMGARRNRAGTAFQVGSPNVPRILEASEDSECEKA